MIIRNNAISYLDIVNIFGNGEVFIQLRPLLEQEGIKINKIFDDFSLENSFNRQDYTKLEQKEVLFCVGYKDMKKRFVRYKELKSHGMDFISFAASNAILSQKISIKNGTIINQGTIIDNFVEIGECVFINIGTTISHHSIINDNVFIAPGVNIAGYVNIKEGAFIGVNSTIIDHLEIGEYSVVAAGAVVIDNVPPFTMVAGNPAVVKKTFVEKPL